MEHKTITWDWKAPAPLERILAAAQMFGEWYFYLPDTGGDFFACIIADTPDLTEDALKQIMESEE